MLSLNIRETRGLEVLQAEEALWVRWRYAVLITGTACVAIIGLFWPTMMTMISIWLTSRTFAHGALVLPVTFYLLWEYRERIASLVPTSSLWGMVFLGVLAVAWLFAHLGNFKLVEQAAVMAMFPGMIWATLGTAVFQGLLFPLGFLIFAVPWGTFLEPWLQHCTAVFIALGLEVANIPMHWEGYVVTIPTKTWEVAPDCGGLRYLLPGLALGYVYAAVIYRDWLRRLWFLSACCGLLMLANGLRAYGIIISDHFGIAEGTDHRVFSYTIFAIVLFLLFQLGLTWRRPEDVSVVIERQFDGKNRPVRSSILTAVVSIAVLSLAPLTVLLLRGMN